MGLAKLKKALQSKTDLSNPKLTKEEGQEKVPTPSLAHARGDFTVKTEKPQKSPVITEKSEKLLTDLRKQEPSVRRVVRASAVLAERLTDDDREEFANVIRRCLHATNSHYDPAVRKAVVTPDYKTQLAAATLGLAYVEGTPVKRIAAIVNNVHSTEEKVSVMKQSPEMLKAVKALSGLGVTIEDDVIDVEAEIIRETGSESGDVA